MRHLRRSSLDVRFEMTPLIDVIFLLLIYFIFVLVVMVRADILDVRLPTLSAGTPAERGVAVTIVLDREGRLFVNGEETPRNGLAARVRDLRAEHPGAKLFVAADEGGRTSDVLALIDLLAAEGLGEFQLLGTPEAAEEPQP